MLKEIANSSWLRERVKISAKATPGVLLEETVVNILTFLPNIIIRAETSYIIAADDLPLDFLKPFGLNKKEVSAAFKYLKTGIKGGKFDITFLKKVTSYLQHLDVIKTLYDAFHVWRGVLKVEKQLKENEKLSEEEQIKVMAKLYMEYMPFITILAKDDKDLENGFKKIIGWAKGKPQLVDKLREWSGKPPINRTHDTQPTTQHANTLTTMSPSGVHGFVFFQISMIMSARGAFAKSPNQRYS